MGKYEPTIVPLRVELSNLRDALAGIESSDIFALNKVGDQEAVNAIRHRIADLDAILKRSDK